MIRLFYLLFLLLPLWLYAESPTSSLDPVQEKFQKLQHEMSVKKSTLLSPSVPDNRSLPFLVLEISLALVAVLGMAVLGIRFLKKIQRGILSGKRLEGDLMEVIESCHIGTNQRLVAVRMDEKVVILGLTRDSISLVSTLAKPAVDLLAERRDQGNPMLFSENLNRMMERFKKPKKLSEFQ